METKPTYKIHGKVRRELKKKIAEQKRYIKYFWHNELTMEVYGMEMPKDEAETAIERAMQELAEMESALAMLALCVILY